ncbi:hypothetical protein CUMW_187700 [Citrus unshiu]|uniref:Uncharacterized protein n=1 Tax=Citrus unshiu TaxID=55188 RepID=A0A2H5Q1K9_CITUN|nr:hypothetical protein CUMW_187700 [Citrus unshiu]
MQGLLIITLYSIKGHQRSLTCLLRLTFLLCLMRRKNRELRLRGIGDVLLQTSSLNTKLTLIN